MHRLHAYAWKSTHMRGNPRICVEEHAYACYIVESIHATPPDHAYAWWSQSSTRMRGKLLQVTSQSHAHAYAYIPTHMRENLIHWPQTNTPRTQLHDPSSPFKTTITYHPRICVHSYAYAWDFHRQTNTPRTQLHRPRICVGESRQTTPMRGRVTPDHFLIAILPRIC
ncbi:hypothetical protein PIB30_107715, partial [Stylosanthes scabra]|nr:hypothetical protein [Stylosanthes scabra]